MTAAQFSDQEVNDLLRICHLALTNPNGGGVHINAQVSALIHKLTQARASAPEQSFLNDDE